MPPWCPPQSPSPPPSYLIPPLTLVQDGEDVPLGQLVPLGRQEEHPELVEHRLVVLLAVAVGAVGARWRRLLLLLLLLLLPGVAAVVPDHHVHEPAAADPALGLHHGVAVGVVAQHCAGRGEGEREKNCDLKLLTLDVSKHIDFFSPHQIPQMLFFCCSIPSCVCCQCHHLLAQYAQRLLSQCAKKSARLQ